MSSTSTQLTAAQAAFLAESQQTTLVAVTIIFLTLATIFVALRFFVRVRLQKIFALDDWFMLAGYVRWTRTNSFLHC